jgi:hypothetical protein
LSLESINTIENLFLGLDQSRGRYRGRQQTLSFRDGVEPE